MVWRYFMAGPGSEHFRRAGRLDADLVTGRDVVSGDHFVVALAGTDHRVHTRVTIDQHLQERRAREIDEFVDDPRHILLAVEAHGIPEAVGLCGLDEILLVERAITG